MKMYLTLSLSALTSILVGIAPGTVLSTGKGNRLKNRMIDDAGITIENRAGRTGPKINSGALWT